jgi:flagellin
MLSLHTNTSSLSIQNALASNQTALSTSMTRLGTGYRINSAADDAAGLQIANRLHAQTSGMAVASQNTQNSISLIQTADGAFEEFTNILVRMKDLATQAADGSTTSDDATALQSEYTALVSELNNIFDNTTYGGESLFDSSNGKLGKGAITFQIGATSAETMSVDVSSSLSTVGTAIASGGSVASGDLTTQSSANKLIDTLASQLDDVGAVRSSLGAAQNRLTHVAANLDNMSTNTGAAEGRLMDVDYAKETANQAQLSILMQASTSMLKQSSQMNQMVLSLLQ